MRRPVLVDTNFVLEDDRLLSMEDLVADRKDFQRRRVPSQYHPKFLDQVRATCFEGEGAPGAEAETAIPFRKAFNGSCQLMPQKSSSGTLMGIKWRQLMSRKPGAKSRRSRGGQCQLMSQNALWRSADVLASVVGLLSLCG